MVSEAYKRLMEKKKALNGHTYKVWSPGRDDEHTIIITHQGRVVHPRSCCNMSLEEMFMF